MDIGTGIAIAGIWLGTGIGGLRLGVATVFVAFFAMLATVACVVH